MAYDSSTRPPLGVGNMISETFSLLFGHFGLFLVLSFVPILIALLGMGGVLGTQGLEVFGMDSAQEGDIENLDFSGTEVLLFGLTMFVFVVFYVLCGAAIGHAAADARVGARQAIGLYIANALKQAVPLIICWIVSATAIVIGAFLFLLPGLWIYGLLSVLSVVIVVEQCGFGGIERSMSLTKDYRWPIVGGFLVIYILAVIMASILGTIFSLIPVIGALLSLALQIICYNIPMIWNGIVYARLREIKDGRPSENLDEVFG
jgi:hypothetical protein